MKSAPASPEQERGRFQSGILTLIHYRAGFPEKPLDRKKVCPACVGFRAVGYCRCAAAGACENPRVLCNTDCFPCQIGAIRAHRPPEAQRVKKDRAWRTSLAVGWVAFLVRTFSSLRPLPHRRLFLGYARSAVTKPALHNARRKLKPAYRLEHYQKRIALCQLAAGQIVSPRQNCRLPDGEKPAEDPPTRHASEFMWRDVVGFSQPSTGEKYLTCAVSVGKPPL